MAQMNSLTFIPAVNKAFQSMKKRLLNFWNNDDLSQADFISRSIYNDSFSKQYSTVLSGCKFWSKTSFILKIFLQKAFLTMNIISSSVA